MRTGNGIIPRRFALGFEVLLLAMAYNAVGMLPEIFGGRPLVLISAALSIAVCENVSASVIFGAVCGALFDLGGYGNIGFYSFALTVCCCIVSSLLQNRLRSNPAAAMFLIFVSALAVITARYIFMSFQIGLIDSMILYFRHGASKAVLTFIAAVPLYFLNRILAGKKAVGGSV